MSQAPVHRLSARRRFSLPATGRPQGVAIIVGVTNPTELVVLCQRDQASLASPVSSSGGEHLTATQLLKKNKIVGREKLCSSVGCALLSIFGGSFIGSALRL